MDTANCPICDSTGATVTIPGLSRQVRCNRCGSFSIDLRIGAVLKDPDLQELRPYLSAHLRQAHERGERIAVRWDTWKALAEGHAHTPVTLRLFCDRSLTVGASVVLDDDDFVLLDAANGLEMNYLVDSLVDQQVLQARGPSGGHVVTPKGWERLSPTDPGGVPGTCFVAMSFDPSLDGLYERGIKPAVEACGLTVINVGNVQYNGVVTDLIHAEIRRAQVIVADVTGQRQNVYFEAGLAIGLGRTVIWSCHEDEIHDVHFDTRQYSHVEWKDAADLRVKLEDRIRGTVSIPVTY
jgi:hypothetical protein